MAGTLWSDVISKLKRRRQRTCVGRRQRRGDSVHSGLAARWLRQQRLDQLKTGGSGTALSSQWLHWWSVATEKASGKTKNLRQRGLKEEGKMETGAQAKGATMKSLKLDLDNTEHKMPLCASVSPSTKQRREECSPPRTAGTQRHTPLGLQRRRTESSILGYTVRPNVKMDGYRKGGGTGKEAPCAGP